MTSTTSQAGMSNPSHLPLRRPSPTGSARPGAEAWLTGGTFGPEASVFALLLVSAVTVVALWPGCHLQLSTR